eukprot:gene20543-27330_t
MDILGNNPENNTDSWVLGWRFTEGGRINDKQDVFNVDSLLESISLFNLEPNGADKGAGHTNEQAVAVKSLMSLVYDRSSSQTSNYSDSYQFSFWAMRGKYVEDYAEYEKLLAETGANTSSTSPTKESFAEPMGMGYPADMFFNNMWCDPVVMTSQVPNAKQQVAVPELTLDQMPQDLSVSYFPITLYYGTPEVLSPLQFNCDLSLSYFPIALFYSTPGGTYRAEDSVSVLSNMDNNTSVNLDDVTLQYWFDGPLDGGGMEEVENYSDIIAAQFALTCSDVSPILRFGCNSLQPRFSRGLPGVKGARYRLDLGFYPGSGYLLPSGSTNDSSLIKDYSYFDDPRWEQYPGDNGTESQEEGEIILRVPTPNYRIPAYIGGNLAWGSPPKAAESYSPSRASLLYFRLQTSPKALCAESSQFSPLSSHPLQKSSSLLSASRTLASSPLASRLSPLASRLSPLASRLSPLASRLSPLASRLSPLASRLLSPARPLRLYSSRLSPPHLASLLSPLSSRLRLSRLALSPLACSLLSPLASRLSPLASRLSHSALASAPLTPLLSPLSSALASSPLASSPLASRLSPLGLFASPSRLSTLSSLLSPLSSLASRLSLSPSRLAPLASRLTLSPPRLFSLSPLASRLSPLASSPLASSPLASRLLASRTPFAHSPLATLATRHCAPSLATRQLRNSDPTAAEGMSGVMQLPPGNTCQLSSDGTQVCGVSMTYCCGRPMSDNSPELATTKPTDWISLWQSSGSVNIQKGEEPPDEEVNGSPPEDDSPADTEDRRSGPQTYCGPKRARARARVKAGAGAVDVLVKVAVDVLVTRLKAGAVAVDVLVKVTVDLLVKVAVDVLVTWVKAGAVEVDVLVKVEVDVLVTREKAGAVEVDVLVKVAVDVLVTRVKAGAVAVDVLVKVAVDVLVTRV